MNPKEIIKPSTKQIIFKYLFMILGCVCYALSLRMFLDPCKITGGGVSGAALLIEFLTGLPASIFIVIINIPISIMGFKMMGWKFTLRCFITYGTLSLFTELFNRIDLGILTEEPILASLYGGILQGIGIGLFIRFEMSSGGTELLGRITHHYFHHGSIAIHTGFFDGIVVFLGAILLKNPENVLYALILIYVSAKVSDLIVLGVDKANLCYIITTKAEEIADFMIKNSPRGITLLQGEGMYSKQPKGVLLTCVKTKQVSYLKASIKAIDEDAFVILCDANRVYGKGFKRI